MNVLEVQGLTKRYPAFTLNGVSFDVPQGAVMGFIGRNGAGKSTTLKSILGMVHPDAGAVRVFGMDYAENERAVRRELGVVLGGIDFYPKKKIKTITDVTRRFYNNWDEEKYRHYLELFHIDESKRVDQLSSGMKVKYMIALALSHNARLLILDEPTSGLDPVSRDELTELLRRWWPTARAACCFPPTSPPIWRSVPPTLPLSRTASCNIPVLWTISAPTTRTWALRWRISSCTWRGGRWMKTLLYKQLRLVCHPMTPVFCLFGFMVIIPNYPYTVIFSM